MRRAPVVLVVVLILFVLLDESNAARGRGSSKGGGRSRSNSNSRSNSKPKSKTVSRSKPKVTKYTPITATRVSSPVIVSQTKIGSRSNTFMKVVVGYIALRYVLSNAPVYRRGYPMYGSYVSIPDKRAIRITNEDQKLLDAEGKLCLGNSSATQTLREGIDEDLVELNTTVKYKNGEPQTYHGINNTISLEDIKEEEFEVTSRARYNTTIVEGTSCTQVEKKVKGTMITLYETNPNTASPLYINNKLLANGIALFVVIYVFQFLY